MVLPILPIIIVAASSGLGIKKTYDAHRLNNEADVLQRKVEEKVRKSRERVDCQRRKTKYAVEHLGQEKVHILSTTANIFVREFSKIKPIQLKRTQGIRELQHLYGNQNVASMQKELQRNSQRIASFARNGITSLSGGAALAFGAYGAVGALGTASTGTAISALSGVAASNATLAWLGGGSLAAGGFGVVGGTAVLGGLIAGPALAIFGCLSASRAQTRLNEVYIEAAQAQIACLQTDTIIERLYAIQDRGQQLQKILASLNRIFYRQVYQMQRIIRQKGTDWDNYLPKEKQTIEMCMLTALGIKKIIDTPLITQDGRLTIKSSQSLLAGKRLLNQIR